MRERHEPCRPGGQEKYNGRLSYFWSMSYLSFPIDQSTTSPHVKVRQKTVLYTKLTTICYNPAQASAM